MANWSEIGTLCYCLLKDCMGITFSDSEYLVINKITMQL